MFKNIALTLAISHFTLYMAAQDIHFAQFTNNPLSVNPAQAGTTVWIRATMDYRSQWSSITDPYTTMSFSFDQKMKKRWARQVETIFSQRKTLFFQGVSETGLGWGLNVFSDKAGTSKMKTTNGNLSLAYQLKIHDHQLFAFGLQGGLAQRSVNYSELKWGSQYNGSTYDPNLSANEDFSSASITYPDFSTGILWSYKKNERYMRGNDQKDIYMGVSVSHLNEPQYSFFGTDETLYRKMIFHGTSVLGIKNTNYSLTPTLFYARQGSAREFFVGTLVRYMLKEDSKYTGYVKGSTFSLGGYYRNKDAVAIAAAFELANYTIGVSYDINVSKLRAASYGRGGLEITLRFLNPSPFLYSNASFNK